MNWGLLPVQVRGMVYQKEWLNRTRLRKWMKKKKEFPLKINLKIPSNADAMQNVEYFAEFIKSWQREEKSIGNCTIIWQEKQYKNLGQQIVPNSLLIDSLQSLVTFLGGDVVTEFQLWCEIIQSFSVWREDTGFLFIVIDYLDELANYSAQERATLLNLLPQLHENMGNGCYLRALNIEKVDTKFIENHLPILTDLCEALYGNVKSIGLLSWLGCISNPKDWLLVRPLCDKVMHQIGGWSVMRLPSEVLLRNVLPAKIILIIENEQSAYGLGEYKDVICVAGCGKNLKWLEAEWLKNKIVGYWGDLDSDGLQMLSDARTKIPHVQALMMNDSTLKQFSMNVVPEKTKVQSVPSNLFPEEESVFQQLRSGVYGGERLEQEKLSYDFIDHQLVDFIKRNNI